MARPGRRPTRAAVHLSRRRPRRSSTPPPSTPPSASLLPGSTISTSACARSLRRPHSARPGRPPPAERPATPGSAIDELRRKLEALESRPCRDGIRHLGPEIRDRGAARGSAIARPGGRRPEGLGREGRRRGQRQHHRRTEGTGRRARFGGDRHRRPHQRGLTAGQPFATDLGLLTPLAQGDAKLGELIAPLQPMAAKGVASRASLAASFPAMAKVGACRRSRRRFLLAAAPRQAARLWFRCAASAPTSRAIRSKPSSRAPKRRSMPAIFAKAVELVKSLPAADHRAPPPTGWPVPRRISPPSARSTSSPRRRSRCWAAPGNPP